MEAKFTLCSHFFPPSHLEHGDELGFAPQLLSKDFHLLRLLLEEFLLCLLALALGIEWTGGQARVASKDRMEDRTSPIRS